ncbi:Ig-like domain-containing protein [Streptomyces pathocidini]|uniref:Ig-like domain-containing protein n=1 Tax=Streptomyces pathocidini TaxID=1650571 RepID=A0ABW7UQX0_9ACTN|nr:Ig-like domain-containing protein [Streptomyces pathocidini]
MHAPSAAPRTRTRRASVTRAVPAAVLAVAGVLALSACGGAGGAGSAVASEPTKVTVDPGNGAKGVEPGRQISVTAKGGELTAVTVTDGSGHKVAGALADRGTTWRSAGRTAPGATYTVQAQAKNDDGAKSGSKASFSTAAATDANTNKLTLAPGAEGATAGVGQPLSIRFDHPVTDKAAVERQLKVDAAGTEGSWGWVKDFDGSDRVDWRPRTYWKPGTKVSLKAALSGVSSGGGRYFAKDYDVSFTIGRSQVVKVDIAAKQLTLYRDGQSVKTLPISAGRPANATWNGKMVLMAKEGTIRMRSETVGLGNAYDKMVDYSMKLSTSGTYAHAAPWNASKFGRVNDSSGCIGMSDADASWLYGELNVGDVFEVTGSSEGTIATGNGFGDWNVDWAQWQGMSALK